ncbi:interferon-inducible GTPase 5-like isoform 2-T3 [Odontesthes bonariensis]|uniref:interferon-inducible GTPase 5-like isoform X2 n=1 Tax=Odontesthes bonariensis TaxID=219752 RepID=UPI003F58593C
MDKLIDPEVKQQIRQLLDVDPAAAAEMIKTCVENNTDIPLNIGITGEAGSGKSSFVNAFRGIDDRHESAAPTGCVETTTDIKPYSHPNYPNVILWDLPGIGTTKYPAEKYLKLTGFEKFDFFIIISDTRFRENDVKLAKEIQKMGKKFYFVRSKIDNDLRAEERGQRDFDPERTLSQIRENCIQGLQKEGFESPQVFLVSNFDLHLYDFSLLHETLDRELPDHKKHALLLAMPNINQEVINNKKEAFQARIKYYATASAAGAAVPVPGLSVAVDVGMIVAVVKQYTAGFGLDVSSLQKLAASTGVQFEDLKSVIRSPLAGAEITGDLILKVLGQVTFITASTAAEEGFKFIPVLGTIVAMSLSSVTTYRVLSYFLDMLAEDSQRVFKRALGL